MKESNVEWREKRFSSRKIKSRHKWTREENNKFPTRDFARNGQRRTEEIYFESRVFIIRRYE